MSQTGIHNTAERNQSEIDSSARDGLLRACRDNNSKQFHDYIALLHVSDIALVLSEVRADERIDFIKKIQNKTLVPDILLLLDDPIRLDILQKLPLKAVASYLENLESDDKLALIEDFSSDLQDNLLSILAPRIRNDLISGLQFAPETAGRVMRREFVSIPDGWNVGQVIDYLRARTARLPEFHNIMVLNKKFAPVGVLKLSTLLANVRHITIRDIMNKNVRAINADMPEEDVVQFFRKYGLVENPVISENNVLLGTITIDDVIEIADEQAEDDMLNLAGVSGHGFHDNLLVATWRRGSWLLVNLMTAIITSIFIGVFDGALEEIVALAILMPIIASMGGNAGMQSLAVTIRAQALGYLTPAIRRRLIFKEIYVGMLNGFLFATLTAFVVFLWFQRIDLSLIIAIAMVVNLMVATSIGSLVPILLAAYGHDPTTGSAVILTTITDIFGFCLFLGLASWFLL